jgi:hypothetical protein
VTFSSLILGGLSASKKRFMNPKARQTPVYAVLSRRRAKPTRRGNNYSQTVFGVFTFASCQVVRLLALGIAMDVSHHMCASLDFGKLQRGIGRRFDH